MPQIPQPLADFARGILRSEARTGDDPHDVAGALERACGMLHERLAPLISSPGFEALIRRAVKLAGRDFPALANVVVTARRDCSFSGLSGALDAYDREQADQAAAAVLGWFFHLLVIFIGEDLGLRKVREVWPGVAYRRGDSSTRVE